MTDNQDLTNTFEEPSDTSEVVLGETAVATDDGATPAVDEAPSLVEQLEAAQAKAAENLEGWQRAVAELANARKRFNQQLQQSHQTARSDAIAKLLPVVDDFDRALEAAPPAIRDDDWFAGLQLVERKLQRLLEDWGVEKIDAVGQPFDPNLHEALASEPSDAYESGIVTRQLVPGYRMGERVIRPSLVYVAS